MPSLPLVVSILVGLILSTTVALAQGRPASVGVETVETRSISETIPLFGEVVTTRDGTVAARIAGTVDIVHVLVGDRVEAGEALAELDTELLEIQKRQADAQIGEALAGIAVAQARVERSENALARVEGLRETSSFSISRFDEATSDLSEARGQLAQAEARRISAAAALAEAEYQLERAAIVAPFAGVALEVNTNPGEYIASGAPVVRLLDTAAFEIEASVPSDYVSALQPGLSVQGETETGEVLDLTVRVLLPIEEATTRTRPVRFGSPVLADMDSLAIGQSITVSIPISAPREVVSVPKDALVQARGGWTVFVVADDVAQPRPVQIGVALGDRFEVLGGLQEGDVVVVRGNERLRPGQSIAVAGQRPVAN